ncbi:Chloroperoxidase [Cantharellus anzutake]|uniref:Chloroperoxidase n=1 Tax=Cantharellus anzutake TaxID=1750568 RepID=UPI001904D929|nr:Chloroperoxidase [Cantharellus anzutake]KAF8338988.1 Chloroperoxidase [Cantharellus anzutake]
MATILQDLWNFFYLQTWDTGLVFINLLTPKIKKGAMYKEGQPGYNGLWPEFIPPNPETDSRSPCPGLNAMANHGIIPRDGRNIPLPFLAEALEKTWNLGAPFCRDTCNSVRKLYKKDTLDLSDLAKHNIIEHDSSLLRSDTFFAPDQTIPDKHLIERLLESATGPATPEHPEGQVTPKDLGKALSLRFAESRRDNPEFSLKFLHAFFAYSNASVFYEILGGDVKTLRIILEKERIPDGYEPFMRSRKGLTMKKQYFRAAHIWFHTNTKLKLKNNEMANEAETQN